jgi:predicted permease
MDRFREGERSRREKDLRDELEAHLRAAVSERMARGESRADAEASAKRELGGTLRVSEQVREAWGWTWLETLRGDFRYGWRNLRSAKGFTATAVLALSLGIGCTTTMFSVLYGVLIDPFPYKNADRLALISVFDLEKQGEGGRRRDVSLAEAREYQKLTDVFEGFANSAGGLAVLDRDGTTYQLKIVTVGGEVFERLGTPTLLGRGIVPRDAEPGSPLVAVLGEVAWQKYFGGAPGIVGQTIRLDQQVRTVIGVVPKRFAWFNGEVWVPDQSNFVTAANPQGIRLLQAWLRPGVKVARANEELTAVGVRLQAAYPALYPKKTQVRAIYSIDDLVGPPFRITLYTLMGAVSLLLLIACSNVANMLLSRATTRYREIGVRMALGASRFRIVRQLLIEALLLASGGAVGGSLLAYGGVRGLQVGLPSRAFANESIVAMNLPVLLFAMALAIFTVLLFGLAPAWQLVKRDRIGSLRGVSRAAGDASGSNWLRDIFAGVQVAMSLVLMVGATLLMRSFVGAFSADPGVDPKTVAIAAPVFAKADYNDAEKIRQRMDEAARLVRALPGVRAAAQSSSAPIALGGVPGEVTTVARRNDKTVHVLATGDDVGVFDAAGYRLAQGQWITDSDVAGKRHIAVINETLARALDAAGTPLIGQQIELRVQGKVVEYELAGVLKDAPNVGLRLPIQPAIHVPVTAFPLPSRFLVVRAEGPADKLLETLRRELGRSVPGAQYAVVQPLDYFLELEIGAHRFAMALLGVFAAAGLALTLIGLYGVMSYAVAKRTYEVGIRMALGARARQVIGLVATRGAVIVAIGMAAGIAGSAAAWRVLGSFLGRTSLHDPVSYGAVIAGLAVTALAAILVPASRALRVDPAQALRHE